MEGSRNEFKIQSRYKTDTELERRCNKGKLFSEVDIKQLED